MVSGPLVAIFGIYVKNHHLGTKISQIRWLKLIFLKAQNLKNRLLYEKFGFIISRGNFRTPRAELYLVDQKSSNLVGFKAHFHQKSIKNIISQ